MLLLLLVIGESTTATTTTTHPTRNKSGQIVTDGVGRPQCDHLAVLLDALDGDISDAERRSLAWLAAQEATRPG